MRVCFVGPMIGRNPGHVTTAGERLADRLAARGHEVIAVSSSPNRYVRFAEIAETLARRASDFDVIALMVFGGPSFVVEDAASWLAQRARVPIVMALRGGAMPTFMKAFPRWSSRVLARATRVITPSRYLARAVEPLGIKAEVIPNPIPIAVYPYRHRAALRPRLFWMRAFHSVYHPELAVRTLACLRRSHPDATLVMAGQDKGLRSAVQRLARDLGLSSEIRFVGFLDMAGKIEEGIAADIFINTNRIDNQPVAVIEACALGLPVVATAVGGIPDLLSDGVTGLLVPEGDEEAMARAIRRLLTDRELASRLSAQGRQVAQASAEEVVVPQWEAILSEACTAVPRGSR